MFRDAGVCDGRLALSHWVQRDGRPSAGLAQVPLDDARRRVVQAQDAAHRRDHGLDAHPQPDAGRHALRHLWALVIGVVPAANSPAIRLLRERHAEGCTVSEATAAAAGVDAGRGAGVWRGRARADGAAGGRLVLQYLAGGTARGRRVRLVAVALVVVALDGLLFNAGTAALLKGGVWATTITAQPLAGRVCPRAASVLAPSALALVLSLSSPPSRRLPAAASPGSIPERHALTSGLRRSRQDERAHGCAHHEIGLSKTKANDAEYHKTDARNQMPATWMPMSCAGSLSSSLVRGMLLCSASARTPPQRDAAEVIASSRLRIFGVLWLECRLRTEGRGLDRRAQVARRPARARRARDLLGVGRVGPYSSMKRGSPTPSRLRGGRRVFV